MVRLGGSEHEGHGIPDLSVVVPYSWWAGLPEQNQHFNDIFKFPSTPYFEYMVTFLDHPQVPRSGNSENMIRVWRQMEKVRYGFKTAKGRLDHLKLYQMGNYLKGEFG